MISIFIGCFPFTIRGVPLFYFFFVFYRDFYKKKFFMKEAMNMEQHASVLSLLVVVTVAFVTPILLHRLN